MKEIKLTELAPPSGEFIMLFMIAIVVAAIAITLTIFNLIDLKIKNDENKDLELAIEKLKIDLYE